MSILDKIPSLAENELFQKLAAIEDITALCKIKRNMMMQSR
jgi:hypothetical protein